MAFQSPSCPARFGKANYGFLYWLQDQVSVGHFHLNQIMEAVS